MASGIGMMAITGRLGRDCEIINLPGGTVLTKLSVAVPIAKKQSDGTWKDVPLWIDAKIIGAKGEAFARFHAKGDLVALGGQIDVDEWTDRETGKPRQKMVMLVTQWSFTGKQTGEATQPDEARAHAAQPTTDMPAEAFDRF